jgi:hypothetical protein
MVEALGWCRPVLNMEICNIVQILDRVDEIAKLVFDAEPEVRILPETTW